MIALLIIVLNLPPVLLAYRRVLLAWPTRYVLAALPAAYTLTGWQLGRLAMTRFNCLGGVKNLHDYSMSGTDITVLVGHGLFLMIPGIFVAAPLSTFLLLDTLCRHASTSCIAARGVQ
ncbi:hypothetical protein [Stutzerimonas xanthomarina]|uniref:hypothetical protein n=1 Tax=Stutzerimonas xanthomarina TaxID=271420 RepID=UPI003AA9B33E